MQPNLEYTLRGLLNIAAWEQLLADLEAAGERADLIYDTDEILFSLRDILLILDGKAD